MSFELIESLPEFLGLKEDWNTLLSQSASHVPFLRHEYLFQWWQNLGGGEWDSGDLTIIVQRGPGQKIIGIAPFFIREGKVLLIGSHEISDYLDLIAAPDHLPAFIHELFDFLESKSFPAWRSLDLYNIPEGSPTIPLLEDYARTAGLRSSLDIIQPAPAIELPASWEVYLDSLDIRYRQEIIRKNRNSESYFLPVDWYITTEEGKLDRDLDDFLDLMANNPDKASFLTDQMKRQIKESAQQAYLNGWLQLAFLTVGDLKAAGYLNFDFNGKIWIYNSGINSVFENISPGWVLLSKIIQWAIEGGKTTVDFMRGNETYKYQFGGIDQNVLRLQIFKD